MIGTCELLQLICRVSALNKFNATFHASIRFVRKFFCVFVFAVNSLDPILSGTFFGGGANIGGGGRQPESNQQPWPWQPSSFLLFAVVVVEPFSESLLPEDQRVSQGI